MENKDNINLSQDNNHSISENPHGTSYDHHSGEPHAHHHRSSSHDDHHSGHHNSHHGDRHSSSHSSSSQSDRRRHISNHRHRSKKFNLSKTWLCIISTMLAVLIIFFVFWEMISYKTTEYNQKILDLDRTVNKYMSEIESLKQGTTVSTGTPAYTPTDIREWDSPIYDANIPVFELSEEKPAMTDAEKTPDALYAMYDALMKKHPQYITKTDLGLCSDGVNHVYCYEFREPDSRHTENFEWSETKAKAIIVSGIHYEWSGMYGLYYALEEIANNPKLYDFRRNSHLIVIPCVNPYATTTENYKTAQGVKNANGVEIHRNFEVDWKPTEKNDKHYGGETPLSEVETQYIDSIMKQNTDAAFFLTCHSFADENYNFIWPSVATAYMCNMGYRLIDKMSAVWMNKYADELIGLEDYRASNIESWDNRLGYAHVSKTNGTETKQAIKYGIQGANVEINGTFWVHGTKENPEEPLSSFTMSRGAEVYVNFLLTAFGVYDPGDKLLYSYK